MKKLSLILIASLALVMGRDFNGAYAGDHDGDGGGGIPLFKLAGKWASASQGSITICFKPDFSASENCSTAGAVPVTFNDPSVTAFTQDKAGNACGTGTDVGSVPGDSHPPDVTVSHGVNKVTSYDPATGSGDVSVANYSGGKCIGSTFDSAGATLLNSATVHFVASDNGERVDFVVTTLTDSVGDFGAFNFTGSNHKQKE